MLERNKNFISSYQNILYSHCHSLFGNHIKIINYLSEIYLKTELDGNDLLKYIIIFWGSHYFYNPKYMNDTNIFPILTTKMAHNKMAM